MNFKKILVTGCAGFIGYHTCKKLIELEYQNIVGIDNINSYYDVKLKKHRLDDLKKDKSQFTFLKIDIKSEKSINNLFKENNFDCVIHLAAQAGVRYSIDYPKTYVENNLVGFFNILNISKIYNVKHFLYASTSSVYGNVNRFPVNESDPTDAPLSFYAATKKSNELMAHAYSNIYKIPTTGLRFFTVYGSYGRPDMALFKFTKNILANKKIDLFNNGNHYRDFTHVKDVVQYITKIMKKPSTKKIPFQIFNIASNNPQFLKRFIRQIEIVLGNKAIFNKLGLQKGDVKKTHGSTALIEKKINYKAKYDIKRGVKEFIKWYTKFYK